jgi:uncharacterized cupredoxin-like copper-binding protein
MRCAFLVALAVGGVAMPGIAADWSQAQTVTVVTTDYHFAPDKLSFKQGVVYRLHLENRGKEVHEFSAPVFFKAADIRNPAVLNADRTEILVHPGEAKDLYFVPQQAGLFPLTCPDHDWTGMTGEITVE